MGDQGTMYALRPLVVLPGTSPRAKTMYEMRNIHEDKTREGGCSRRHDADAGAKMPDVIEQIPIIPTLCVKSTGPHTCPLPEFNALEARQEKILSQLAELKKQVSTLSKFLKQSHQVEARNCVPQEIVHVSLVVNANPKRPPYSILALQKLWKDTDVRVTSYIHSTVVGQAPIDYPISTRSTANNVINLALIWKEVDDLEVISGLHNYSIIGESNFLRYISRLLNKHNYERTDSSVQPHVIDEILDLCHCVHYQESPNKVQQRLSAIGSKLERTNWKGEGESSIADIAAWSKIKQLSPRGPPSNLNKWYGMCEKVFA